VRKEEILGRVVQFLNAGIEIALCGLCEPFAVFAFNFFCRTNREYAKENDSAYHT